MEARRREVAVPRDEQIRLHVNPASNNPHAPTNDGYGYVGELQGALSREKHRSAMWAIACAGGCGSAGDTRDVPFWRMSPHKISYGVYMLGAVREQYVIYTAQCGSIRFRIPAASYRVFRYDPRYGDTVELPFSGGGDVDIRVPTGNDSVVHLRRTDL